MQNEVYIDNEKFEISQDQVKLFTKIEKLIGGLLTSIIIFILLWIYSFNIFTCFFSVLLYLLGLLFFLYLIMRFSPQNIKDILINLVLPSSMEKIDKKLKLVKLELLKTIEGKVLDVGCASGTYLPYYKDSQKKVTQIVALEPNQKMHNQLSKNIKKYGLQNISKITSKYLENLDFCDGYFDSIVLGNVLCEIPDIQSAIQVIERLLKPGGRVYYVEHVLEKQGNFRRKFQNSINWYWSVVQGGCNCNKDSLKFIQSVQNWEVFNWTLYLDKIFYPVQKFEVGICVKY